LERNDGFRNGLWHGLWSHYNDIILGAIIWLVISLINAGTQKSEETPESALDILKRDTPGAK